MQTQYLQLKFSLSYSMVVGFVDFKVLNFLNFHFVPSITTN